MREKLTELSIKAKKPPATGRVTIADAEGNGLFLRITNHGVKSWLIRYRPKGQIQRYEIPGEWRPENGGVSLSTARQRARDITAAAKRGIDLPGQERDSIEAARQAAARARTLRQVLSDYIEKHAKKKLRTWRPINRLFEMHVFPRLGDKSVPELRRSDMIELFNHLQDEKGLNQQTNRVRSNLSSAFEWAVERGEMSENPIIGTKRRRGVEAERHRVLTNKELRAIWKAADGMTDPARSFVKALILTGQRRDEIRLMRWDEINDAGTIFTLPRARNKGDRDHDVPLAEAMRALLAERPRCGRYVFAEMDGRPFSGWARLKERLDETSGVSDWRFHDIRRTTRSGLAELGIPFEVAERCLNHAVGKLERIYNRHTYLPEKAAAFEKWAERVSLLVSDGRAAPNVLELRPSA